MDLEVARELDSPTVISDEVGGETLVLNLGTGAYYVVPESSRAVWEAISTGVPAASLLDGPEDPRAEELSTFAAKVVEAGLLRDAASAVASAGDVTWTAGSLTIDEHTDMADLLGLDPIHDADESVGWPMQRTEG